MRRRRSIVALALVLVALALTIAACGSGDGEEASTGPAPSADAPSGDDAPSLNAFPPEFVQCLERQGIDVESVTDVSAVIHSPEGERCFDELHGE